MIKGEHLHKEITTLNEVAKGLKNPFEHAMVQIGVLSLKLLLNIRQNQVAIMTAQGVDLIKPNRTNATEKVEE